MANAAGTISSLENCLPDILSLETGWYVAANSRSIEENGATEGWQEAQSQRSHHRFTKREDKLLMSRQCQRAIVITLRELSRMRHAEIKPRIYSFKRR